MDKKYINILICVKPIKSSLIYPDDVRNEEFVINPYDLYSLKEILKLKEIKDCRFTCISMGQMMTKEILVKCLAMGVDDAILLSDKEAFSGSDTVATSRILAMAVKKAGPFDIIVCGGKAVDGETGQVKYGLAERLGMSCITDIDEIEEADLEQIIVRTFNGEHIDEVKAVYPVLISYHKFTLVNDMISLLRLKQVNKKEIHIWGREELCIDKELCGFEGSLTEVIATSPVKNKCSNAKLIEGDILDKVKFMIDLINNNN